jgi:hypothetical protein
LAIGLALVLIVLILLVILPLPSLSQGCGRTTQMFREMATEYEEHEAGGMDVVLEL